MTMPLFAKLVRNLFYPLALYRRGECRELSYRREFERTQFLAQEELRALQWRRLDALLRHAHARCPFYRKRFEECGLHPEDISCLEDLRLLPPLEKRDIQEHCGAMVAEGWPADDLIRNQT